ncbi:MAG: GNAT family N-acetyltransferase [Tannerella sp.]|jgi:diamine N-acetyltransferase|nr:GNAT family N-acetyltransferase [Tannerella sp.]
MERKLLENENIRLRALEPEDLEQLYVWENDTGLWERGSTLAPYSRYVLKQYIAESGDDIYRCRQLRLMIELKETAAAVGTIDVYDFDPHHRRAGVGILIDPGYQRKGIATEALTLLIQYVFSFLKLHQLYACIPVANTPSRRLFEQCGFQSMGLLKEWLLTADGYVDVIITGYILN